MLAVKRVDFGKYEALPVAVVGDGLTAKTFVRSPRNPLCAKGHLIH